MNDRKVLEVIVTSAAEASEAEAGGADRLELVRNLAVGGLTPYPDVIQTVLKAVRIPVRVMLRETPSMSLERPADLERMRSTIRTFRDAPIDGWVLGFLNGTFLDEQSLEAIALDLPHSRFTFHRAFDELDQPQAALEQLKKFGQVDRILTVGGEGDWAGRKARLLAWQAVAQPEITILVGVGQCRAVLADVAGTAALREVHVGRAARIPSEVSGAVSRDAVRAVKNALA